MQEKNSTEQLKSIVAERDKRIKSLEEQIEQLQENAAVAQMTSNQQFFLKNPNLNEPENNNHANGNNENEFLKQNSQIQLSSTSRSNINTTTTASNNQNTSVKTRPDSATLVERETISSRYILPKYLK
jgi:hypothetical protein